MAGIQVLEFKLEIGLGSQGAYPVSVLESPTGQAQETIRLPLIDLTFDNLFAEMQTAILPSGASLPEQKLAVQELGRWLYETAFTGEVRTLYVTSQQKARQQHKLLRLILSVKPPELAVLPWEYLYTPGQDDYLCLTDLSLVHYLEQPEAAKLASVAPPLRILGLAVDPPGLPGVAEKTKRRLEAAIQPLQSQDLAEVTWVEGQSWDDLQRSLRLGDWHVIYLATDGGSDAGGDGGVVALTDPDGSNQDATLARLSSLLARHPSLRLVVLGASRRGDSGPRTSTAAGDLVRRGVPAVLAIEYCISEQAESTFFHAFYRSLLRKPLDLALADARTAVHSSLTGSLEWGAPVLYTHAPDLSLFDRETLAATVTRRGDEAMDRDDYDKAAVQYSLAIEMGAGAAAQEKKALAEEIRRTLGKAREILRTPVDDLEAQADTVIVLLADLERMGRKLPDSQAIEIELGRMQKAGLTLRDQVWENARQLMQAKSIGLTLDQRQRRMEESVRMLEKATMLDREELPDLKQDLARAVRRLNYLQASRSQARTERGRRWRVYALVGTVVVVILALLCFGLRQIPFSSLMTRNTPTQVPPASPTSVPVVAQAATDTPAPDKTSQPTAVPTDIAPLVDTATPTAGPTDLSTGTPELGDTPTSVPTPGTAATAPQAPPATSPPPATEQPSATPTPLPTATSGAAPKPPSPIPVPTILPTETPTPGIIYPAPVLLEPDDISLLSQTTFSIYPLRWEWEGVLQENEWFDVRVWQEGMPHYGVAWTKEREYLYDLCLQGNGPFSWSIAVIRGEEGEWLGDLSPEAAPRQFTSARSDAWCRRHNRFSLPSRTGQP